jgi:molybdate transport system substrate-binding protein
MKTSTTIAGALLSVLFAAVQPTSSYAAEIRVLSTHAAQEVLEELGPQFERATGHKLSFGFDPAAAVRRQIEEGAAFDVAIVTRSVIDDLARKNKVRSDMIGDIGRSGLGVAIRKGAPKPDISTVEAFKRTLLAAKSVVRSTEGTSGAYFDQLMGRLGIAAEMKDKIKLGPSGRIAEMAARGEVEIAVQQISEILPVKGAELVGPFPPEVQLNTMFSAGVGTAAKEPQAAKALISFLTGPAAAPVIKSKGLEPAQ